MKPLGTVENNKNFGEEQTVLTFTNLIPAQEIHQHQNNYIQYFITDFGRDLVWYR